MPQCDTVLAHLIEELLQPLVVQLNSTIDTELFESICRDGGVSRSKEQEEGNVRLE